MKLADSGLLREVCYINGDWVAADNGQRINVINPATGESLGSVPRMGAAETRRALEAAEQALPAWRALTAKERAARLQAWFREIMNHQEDLAQIMTAEQGKPLAESRGEIAFAAAYVEFYAEEGKRIYGDVIPSPNADRRLLVTKEPIGDQPFLGILVSYGFVQPLVTNIEFINEDELSFYQVMSNVIVSYAAGAPPMMAAESGRRAIPGDRQPTSEELETLLKSLSPNRS